MRFTTLIMAGSILSSVVPVSAQPAGAPIRGFPQVGVSFGSDAHAARILPGTFRSGPTYTRRGRNSLIVIPGTLLLTFPETRRGGRMLALSESGHWIMPPAGLTTSPIGEDKLLRLLRSRGNIGHEVEREWSVFSGDARTKEPCVVMSRGEIAPIVEGSGEEWRVMFNEWPAGIGASKIDQIREACGSKADSILSDGVSLPKEEQSKAISLQLDEVSDLLQTTFGETAYWDILRNQGSSRYLQRQGRNRLLSRFNQMGEVAEAVRVPCSKNDQQLTTERLESLTESAKGALKVSFHSISLSAERSEHLLRSLSEQWTVKFDAAVEISRRSFVRISPSGPEVFSIESVRGCKENENGVLGPQSPMWFRMGWASVAPHYYSRQTVAKLAELENALIWNQNVGTFTVKCVISAVSKAMVILDPNAEHPNWARTYLMETMKFPREGSNRERFVKPFSC